MDDILNKTIFGNPLSIIIKYISLTDLYNLSLICKKMYKILHNKILPIFKSNIVNNLKYIFKDQYIIFIKQMYKYQAKIYGSFIIQCLLEETYDNSDVDIFIDNQYNFDKFTKYMINTYNNICCRNLYDTNVINTNVNNKLIQFIHNTNKQQFDFNICEGTISFDNNNDIIINKLNYSCIFNKTCVINNDEYKINTMQRLIKYANRGFIFNTNIDVLLYVEYNIVMNNLFNDYHIYFYPYIDKNIWSQHTKTTKEFQYNDDTYKILKCSKSCSTNIYLNIDHLHCHHIFDICTELIFLDYNKHIDIVNKINPYIVYPNYNYKLKHAYSGITKNTSINDYINNFKNSRSIKKNNNNCNIIS